MRGSPICQNDRLTARGVAAARVIAPQLLAPAARRELGAALLGVARAATRDRTRIRPLNTGVSPVGELAR